VAAIVTPLQIAAGDLHGINTLEHQPAKVMAMEGHYKSYPDGAPFYLFGLPDDEAMELKAAVGIPKLSSFILEHEFDAPLEGLDSIPEDARPPVPLVFWCFRIMVGIGLLMIGVGLFSLWRRSAGDLYTNRWLHRATLALGPSGFVAVLAGWIVTEVGRQPFVVYGQLRTADAASPLAAEAVGASLLAFIIIYFIVFGAGVFYMLRLAGHPPQPGEPGAEAEKGPIRTAGVTPAPQAESAIPAPGE